MSATDPSAVLWKDGPSVAKLLDRWQFRNLPPKNILERLVLFEVYRAPMEVTESNLDELAMITKACPTNSLLAHWVHVVMMLINNSWMYKYSLDNMRPVSDEPEDMSKLIVLCWRMFVSKLRDCWHHDVLPPAVLVAKTTEEQDHTPAVPEQKINELFGFPTPIVPTEPQGPDMNWCLVYQKIQMVAACMMFMTYETELHKQCNASTAPCISSGPIPTGWNVEDEFFDAEGYMNTTRDGVRSVLYTVDTSAAVPIVSVATLFNHPTVPIAVPFTQSPGYLTGDIIHEQQSLMLKLGTGDHAQQVRAKLQSSRLISDIQAFQAANPGAVFADFVRWYSPRDWTASVSDNKLRHNAGSFVIIPSCSRHGTVSDRMHQDSMWQSLWTQQSAAPITAQPRLFDAITEGEKAFDYLYTLRPLHLMSQIMRVAAVSCYHSLTAQCSQLDWLPETIRSASQNIVDVVKSCCSLFAHEDEALQDDSQSLENWERYGDDVGHLEWLLSLSTSLHDKLGDHVSFSNDVTQHTAYPDKVTRDTVLHGHTYHVDKHNVDVTAVPPQCRRAVASILNGGRGLDAPLPSPVLQEIVLTCDISRPQTTSISTPQRLYVSIDDERVKYASVLCNE